MASRALHRLRFLFQFECHIDGTDAAIRRVGRQEGRGNRTHVLLRRQILAREEAQCRQIAGRLYGEDTLGVRAGARRGSQSSIIEHCAEERTWTGSWETARASASLSS